MQAFMQKKKKEKVIFISSLKYTSREVKINQKDRVAYNFFTSSYIFIIIFPFHLREKAVTVFTAAGRKLPNVIKHSFE
jgi:hypothetical protein